MCLAQYLVNVVKMLNSMPRIWGWESVFGEAPREIMGAFIMTIIYFLKVKSKRQ